MISEGKGKKKKKHVHLYELIQKAYVPFSISLILYKVFFFIPKTIKHRPN